MLDTPKENQKGQLSDYKGRKAKIVHDEGAQDDLQVVIRFYDEEGVTEWKPKNRAILSWILRWLHTEDKRYPFYGAEMPWWMVTMLFLGNTKEVLEMMDEEEKGTKQAKKNMVTMFEKSVVRHADDAIHKIENMKSKCENRLEKKGETV